MASVIDSPVFLAGAGTIAAARNKAARTARYPSHGISTPCDRRASDHTPRVTNIKPKRPHRAEEVTRRARAQPVAKTKSNRFAIVSARMITKTKNGLSISLVLQEKQDRLSSTKRIPSRRNRTE